MKCPFCGRYFDYLPTLVNHVRCAHPINDKCPICGWKCKDVGQHFKAMSRICKLHAVFYYLYCGRFSKHRRKYAELVCKYLENGLKLEYRAGTIGRIFYSIYDNTVLIRRLDNNMCIIMRHDDFVKLYESLGKVTDSFTLLAKTKKMGLNIRDEPCLVLRVMREVFGGRIVVVRGHRMVYYKSGVDHEPDKVVLVRA